MFKAKYSLSKRQAKFAQIKAKYPDQIPVIVEHYQSTEDPQKYLVQKDITVGQFVYILRKRNKLAAPEAVHLFIDNVIPATSALISQMYKEFHDLDGFLYITIHKENTFGWWDWLVGH